MPRNPGSKPFCGTEQVAGRPPTTRQPRLTVEEGAFVSHVFPKHLEVILAAMSAKAKFEVSYPCTRPASLKG